MPASIDWSRLRHAYGKATDVPAMLARLSGDAAARRAAVASLESALVHQGTHYSASAAAVPFVLDAIDGAEATRVLSLVVGLAVGDPSLWYAKGYDDARAYPALRAAHRAVVAGAKKRIVPCLSDGDAGVRAMAAYTLGLLPESDAHDALRAAVERESDLGAQASAILALGLSARSRGEPLTRLPAVPDTAVVHAAMAIARGWTEGVDAAVDAALRTVADSDFVDARVPWNGGDLASLARVVLLARSERRPDATLDALLVPLKRGRDVGRLLYEAKEKLLPGNPATLAVDLPGPARRLFEFAAALDAPFQTQLAPYRTDYGCDARVDVRRYLGLDPPSAYETGVVVDGVEQPLWRWLRDFDADLLVRALAAAPPAVAVRAAVTAARYPHGIESQRAPDVLVDVLVRGVCAHGLDAYAPLVSEADALLTSRARHFDDTLVVAALDRLAAERGAPLDDRWDALLVRPMMQGVPHPTKTLRAILARLPLPRREALVLRCPPTQGTELCGAWRFYDLCPTAPVLRSLVAHVATFGRGKSEARDSLAVALLRAGADVVRTELEAGVAGKAPRRDLYALALGRAEAPKRAAAKKRTKAT